MKSLTGPRLKTLLCTLFALIAFAGNSILCRLALGGFSGDLAGGLAGEPRIDAASFTVVRLLSGILVLMVLMQLMRFNPKPSNQSETSQSADTSGSAAQGSWWSALMLFGYAVAFSFAYLSLDTATGALVLFGAVQITMILFTVFQGNRLHSIEWIGVVVSFGGFVYLVWPDLTRPSLTGFVLMTMAGIAWAVYTLNGRGSLNPMADTAFNFMRTAPFVLVLALVALPQVELTLQGCVLAVLSGAIASGLGYTVWYIALGGLSATLAAVVQLLVPVIAAMGGVIFVGEAISWRLVIAGLLILGGILAVVLGRYRLASR